MAVRRYADPVRELLESFQLHDTTTDEMLTIWNVRSMFDAARVLGAAVRHVHEREAAALQRAGVDFNVSMIFGGQIQGERMRLFQVYSAGNFIEATGETPYEDAQYLALGELLGTLTRVLPVEAVTGHEHIAPGRKQDPGPSFDWDRVREMVPGRVRIVTEPQVMP